MFCRYFFEPFRHILLIRIICVWVYFQSVKKPSDTKFIVVFSNKIIILFYISFAKNAAAFFKNAFSFLSSSFSFFSFK